MMVKLDDSGCDENLCAPSCPANCEEVYSTPAVDIYETRTEIVILADLPGVSPEDLDLDLDEESLTITGKAARGGDEGVLLLSEYSGGAYCRAFHLGGLVDRKQISASLEDGVLRIVLRKQDRKVARKIPVVTA
jgi:HSP20 family protein